MQTENKRKNLVAAAAVLLLAALLCLSSMGVDKLFVNWSKDSAGLAELKAYVEAVTRRYGKDFIPEEDRIAVFDLDGTLFGELAPTYFEWWTYTCRVLEDPDFRDKATPEMIETAQYIRNIPVNGTPEWLEAAHIRDNAKAFAGLTVEEYKNYIREFASREAVGFENVTYAELFYRPMLEVVDYLTDNGFTVFIVSGTDTLVCRTLLEGVLDLPPYQIVGSVYSVEPDGQGEKDGLDYVMTPDDVLIRDGSYVIKNVKANKVKTISEHIGKQPVLAFGNSTGDFSMAMMTTSNNPYPSKAFFVVADDDVREYGNAEKAASMVEKITANGWSCFSMKNDWLTIYGEDVLRTSRTAA